jgi:ATP-dependent DNA ligase
MLCQDFEVDLEITAGMLDTDVTAAYRKAVEERLPELPSSGVVAEYKYDGTRIIVDLKHREITIVNRHGAVYTIRLPEIRKAAEPVKGDCMLDGEATFINPKTGREEFTGSQIRCSTYFPDPMLIEQYPITMQAFDLIERDGKSLEDLEYWKRKEELLEVCMQTTDSIRFVPYVKSLQGAWKDVVRKNLEGLILKETDSRYEHERSYSWRKLKNWRFETCKVIGYTEGSNARMPFFGSLVLTRNGEYRGCVGSGFNEWELRKLKDILNSAEITDRPVPYERVGEPYRAVKTDLHCLVKFYEITGSGVMRHPVFITTQ